MMLRANVLAILALFAAAACLHTQDPLRAIVYTQQGPVRGGVEEAGILSFKGIPYVAAPTGERGWRPPEPPSPWNEARDATQFGPLCVQPQRVRSGLPATPPQRTSEDCPTLNVWTPAKSATARLPVMVWLPGGNFNLGGGSTAVQR